MSFWIVLLISYRLLRMLYTVLVHFLFQKAHAHIRKEDIEDLESLLLLLGVESLFLYFGHVLEDRYAAGVELFCVGEFILFGDELASNFTHLFEVLLFFVPTRRLRTLRVPLYRKYSHFDENSGADCRRHCIFLLLSPLVLQVRLMVHAPMLALGKFDPGDFAFFHGQKRETQEFMVA